MPAVDDLLAAAHAHVSKAGSVLAAGTGFEAMASGLQCLTLASLLQELGAAPDADLLGETSNLSALQHLNAAALALDAIAPDDRPLRLGVARAELTGAVLNLSNQESIT